MDPAIGLPRGQSPGQQSVSSGMRTVVLAGAGKYDGMVNLLPWQQVRRSGVCHAACTLGTQAAVRGTCRGGFPLSQFIG